MKKIIFVYNADSSVFSRVTDYTHKILSPRTYNCNLCAITYGNLGIKKSWKEFVGNLSIKAVFLHKDEFKKTFKNQGAFVRLPAVFIEEEGNLKLLIDSKEINEQKTVEDLKNLVSLKLKI